MTDLINLTKRWKQRMQITNNYDAMVRQERDRILRTTYGCQPGYQNIEAFKLARAERQARATVDEFIKREARKNGY